VGYWSKRTKIPAKRFIAWIGIASSKFFQWKERYGKVNEHNSWIPRDHWIEEVEKEAIIKFAKDHPSDGYRRLTFMMLDQDIAAVSPSSVYRILSSNDLLNRWNNKPTSKDKGFVQPLEPNKHWHTDISYINICGTFYYLCSALDGCSRYLVHWEIREQMKEKHVELIIQKAREQYPGASPRIISDNGPQYISRDFKKFIEITGMSHVRTSPYYPQSNGKIERWHKTLKSEAIRPKTPLSLEDVRNLVADFVKNYNESRLHSSIGYVTPKDRMEGRHEQIWKERDLKLEKARERRRENRRKQRLKHEPVCI
jgi:putative transposase